MRQLALRGAGGPATMLCSLDRGESWRVIDLRPHAGMILDVKFFDVMNGFVCAASAEGNALILRTRDAGEIKIRIVRDRRTTRVFAIGVEVRRRDLA